MSLSGCRTQAGRPQRRPVARVRPSAWTQSVSRAPLDPPCSPSSWSLRTRALGFAGARELRAGNATCAPPAGMAPGPGPGGAGDPGMSHGFWELWELFWKQLRKTAPAPEKRTACFRKTRAA